MKMLVGALFAFLLVGAAGAAGATEAKGNLSGVWWTKEKVAALRPQDGTAIPFTPKGEAEYSKNQDVIKEIDSKPPSLHDMRRCIPAGVPRVWGSGFPFQIMQRSDMIVIAYERDHIRRFVYMDEKLDTEAADPAYMGSAVGHWDGDTLVIQSGAYKDRTFLDESGLPHGEELSLTERIRRVADEDTLEVVITISDPEMYVKPWTVRYTFQFQPAERIQQYMCGVGFLETRFGTIGEVPKLRHLGS